MLLAKTLARVCRKSGKSVRPLAQNSGLLRQAFAARSISQTLPCPRLTLRPSCRTFSSSTERKTTSEDIVSDEWHKKIEQQNLVQRISQDFTEDKHGDTIFQLSSGSNRAGVAMIRISGPQALAAFSALSGRASLQKRLATLCDLHSPATGSSDRELLDSKVLAISFPSPNSFTGEDIVELHVHGSPVVVRGVLQALGTVAGCRMANAGEFTRRAFENGKLDLTQVEGLADLLAAETEQQRKQAIRQMKGELGQLYNQWRVTLTECLAYVEAIIDFSEDEQDVGEQEIIENVIPRLHAVAAAIKAHLTDNRRGEILREGVNVCIVGPPNAGKSSLLNTLARRSVAIVSSIPGTTRDILEVPLNLGGFPVIVADTAGIRKTSDEIEQEGVRRARARRSEADVLLAVFDVSAFLSPVSNPHELDQLLELIDSNTVVVFNKSDLISNSQDIESAAKKRLREVLAIHGKATTEPTAVCFISCADNAGIADMLRVVEAQVKSKVQTGAADAPVITRERHRQHLAETLDFLTKFHELHEGGVDLALAAEDLRQAVRALGRIVGRVDVEDLLDVIFRDFCIGK